METHRGVWRINAGEEQAFTPLGFLGIPPKTDAIAGMDEAAFPFAERSPVLDRAGASGTVIRFPLERDERVYGFGLHFRRLNHRNQVMQLQVDHYGGRDDGRTHASFPFYVTSRGYGVLLNTAKVVTVDVGTSVRRDDPKPPPVRDRNMDRAWDSQPPANSIEFNVPASGVEVIVFGGNQPLDAVRRYNLYCGGGFLPPRWGLGFWHRVPTLYSDEQVEAEVNEFRERGFPLDVVGLEPGWHSKSYPCTFEWDEGRFPNPSAFVKRMDELGVRVNLWENPYVSPESGLYETMEPLSGSHTVWGGLVPDFTMPEAREALSDHRRQEHVVIGVSGYKLDEVDGYDKWLWPHHATFPSGRSGEEMRQTYGIQLQKLTSDLYRTVNRRTYGLVRGSYIGASSLPYALYSDAYDHKTFITALCNCGFSGLLWSPEVRSGADADDWMRRMQTVCFSPMAMLNAWASKTKPWDFPHIADAVRDAMLLRMRFLPYLYSAFARYREDGTPPFRAMPLEGVEGESVADGTLDDTANPYASRAVIERADQYLMGDSVLVAPLFRGETTREVAFPDGAWFDFYTGKHVSHGGVQQVSAPLERIPLFVRDGGIIPLMPEMEHIPKADRNVPLEVRAYGTKDGVFRLYDDDGETFDFERGDCSWTTLRTVGGNGEIEAADRYWFYDPSRFEWKRMTDDA